jgi:phosphoribosylaminoimidazole-succinocarboxamide synthase
VGNVLIFMVIFLGSMHTLPNQMVKAMKAGRKGTREITRMVPIEMVVMRSLKMGSLVRMGKFGSSFLPFFLD